ncbi:glycosyltransferase, partial [Candidatus Gottesmanbacteria bacterium]|nr:glycosyltransferase [Candidatus Gottesmanbacteria bacterium]
RGYLTKRLNEGLRMTTTEFFARMDSHNLADKTRLEKQRTFLLKNKNVVLAGSNFIRKSESGEVISRSNFPLTWGEIKNKIMEKNFFKHASWFARYEVLKKEGFYNEDWRFSQDYEFLLRLVPKYPVAILPDYLLTEIQIKKAMSQVHRFDQALLVLRAQIKSLKWYPKWQIIYLLRTAGYVINSFIWQYLHVFKTG